jgi:hypothetical protein
MGQGVDRLLASPQYGERWGRHWLDLARYADSDGFKADATGRTSGGIATMSSRRSTTTNRTTGSFASRLPATSSIRGIGTRSSPWASTPLDRRNQRRRPPDSAPGNARRHHQRHRRHVPRPAVRLRALPRSQDRSDPPHRLLPLQAFFANTSFGDGPLPLADRAEQKAYDQQKAAWEEKTKDVRAEMAAILEPLRKSKVAGGIKTFEDEVQAAILLEPSKRDSFQRMMYHTASTRIEFDEEPDARTLRSLKGDAATRYAELKKQLSAFDAIRPKPLDQGQFMIDIGRDAPEIHTLKNGNVQNKGPLVQPGFLSILDPTDAKITAPEGMNSTGRRSVLAGWLTDPKNPLPARVMANRIWHYHFGRGIVATPGDFGRMGQRPTHPELLDYLASTFVENGWKMKAMHRLILLSNTYQQSSATQDAAAKVDPDNKLLWRLRRHRMEAEAIRDSMLFVSGTLNPRWAAPACSRKVPKGVLTRTLGDGGGGRMVNREGSGPGEPPQRLHLRAAQSALSDAAGVRQRQQLRERAHAHELGDRYAGARSAQRRTAHRLGERVCGTAYAARTRRRGRRQQINRAFKLAYGRDAKADELEAAAGLLPSRLAVAGSRAKALIDFCHTLLASNEFLYVQLRHLVHKHGVT